jgi:hypothetical protein
MCSLKGNGNGAGACAATGAVTVEVRVDEGLQCCARGRPLRAVRAHQRRRRLARARVGEGLAVGEQRLVLDARIQFAVQDRGRRGLGRGGQHRQCNACQQAGQARQYSRRSVLDHGRILAAWPGFRPGRRRW